MRVKTIMGKEIDMARLIANNENALAIGNARLNARGDVIGPRGQVVKTREDVAAEYHRTSAAPVKHVPLRDLAEEVLPAPKKAQASMTPTISPPSDTTFVDPATAVADNTVQTKKTTRKITDSEE